MSQFAGRDITVFGAAKSGLAAAKKLAGLGARVFLTELKSSIDPGEVDQLTRLGVKFELGKHTEDSISQAELIVVSPGIHLDIPLLERAQKKTIPIISEIELASRLLKKPLIAVTGTNGKTTTATLIGEMLRAGGKRVAVAGNIGNPLVEVDDRSLDYIVAEVSSYQLEAIDRFRPWISLILNLQPDHLERHHSMDEYARQKARIFMNQTGDDYLIYNQEDPLVVEMIKGARAKLIGFTKNNTKIITLQPSEIRIPGRHNLENALAAAQAALLCGVRPDTIATVLRDFPGVEHRIEYVTTVNGVEFRNDSKGTNPDSTMVALDTFEGRGIILILGGRDKGVSLEPLVSAVNKKVKAVILIGEAEERFQKELTAVGYSNIHSAGFSMENAVKTAYSLAEKGDIVLLSPACASFDMFNNYEERGKVFKTLCIGLK